MITVLHTESSEGWGGQENRTMHECAGLAALGERIVILCRPASRIRVKAEAAGFRVYTHPMRGSYDIGAVACVMRIIRDEKVDIINTHSGVDSFVAAVAGRLSARRPRIVRTRHLALPITSRTTYSLLPHMVVAVSDYVRRYLVEEKGIPGDRVVSIPTGVDLKRFDPDSAPDTLRAELGVDGSVPVVGTVAILRRKKGHHVLLDAIPLVLKAVPDALFVFAGDGPQRENIEERIRELGIGKSVRLLGLRGDVPSVIRGLDLFVLPTLQEALGTSILEASAMGKAVVATRVGGVPEVVRDMETGVLVAPEDPAGLSEAVIRCLRDREMRLRMGRQGRRLVEDEYSTGRMVEKMRGLYMGLVGARRG